MRFNRPLNYNNNNHYNDNYYVNDNNNNGVVTLLLARRKELGQKHQKNGENGSAIRTWTCR